MSALSLAFLLALEQVESGGRCDAVGDHGKSLGALQIQRAVVVDVNETFGTHYRWADAHDKEKARAICALYLHRYLPETATMEEGARTWNGGPTGSRKESTKTYWRKVKLELDRQNGTGLDWSAAKLFSN
jgi:hypothetical protein